MSRSTLVAALFCLAMGVPVSALAEEADSSSEDPSRFEAFRAGACLGLDTSCWSIGAKVEYAGKRYGASLSGAYIAGEIFNSAASIKKYRDKFYRWSGDGGLRTYFHFGVALHMNSTDNENDFENGISPGGGFGADIHVGWDTRLVLQPQISMVILPSTGEDISALGTASLGALLAF